MSALTALVARVLAAALARPVGFFFAFRWLTWLLAFGLVYSRSTPAANRINEPGLLMYTALQLALGTLYALVLHPRLADSSQGLRVLRPPYDLVAGGLADMLASLGVVYFSGGWGSPFWHYAVTSLLVPCFLLPPLWGMVTVAGYAGAYALVVVATGSLEVAMVPGQRNLFIGNIGTAFLVAIAVSYLGALFRALQDQRLRTRNALEETEALFSVAQNVVQAGIDVKELLSRLTQVVRGSGLFPKYAIYLTNEDGALRLETSSVGMEDLPTGLVERAAQEQCTITSTRSPQEAWQVAIPLVAGKELLGIMVAGTKLGDSAPRDPTHLAEAVASQVALGIHNAYLAQQKAELAAQEERSRLAREIHDGIAQSIYMLSLHLETCADLAEQQRRDLRERLAKLVTMSKQTLLEVRHYIFDLKPYLAGEKGVVSMLDNQVREFNKVAGVSANLATQGPERQLPVPVATCLYRVTQEAMANTLRHAQASRVDVLLEFAADAVQLTVRDDGRGFDSSAAAYGHGLSNMRQRAEELDGTFSLKTAPGAGTQITVRLPC